MHPRRSLPPHLPEKATLVLGTLLAVMIAAFLHESLSGDRVRPQRMSMSRPALDALRFSEVAP